MSDDNPKRKREQAVLLYPAQIEHLEAMMREHDLPDVGKALRCLVNYSLHEKARRPEIYKKVRCGMC